MSNRSGRKHRLLIVGGQKSGKSRHAEERAAAWLAASPAHRAVLIATATAGDAEMRARIERHRADRALRLPAMTTLEEPVALAAAVEAHSRPDTLLVVDCLTLWLSNLQWRSSVSNQENYELNTAIAHVEQAQPAINKEAIEDFVLALGRCKGPVVMVSNEIGLGVVPMGRDVRAFVDALGLLNQRMAAASNEVVLMAAGLPLTLKQRLES
jgi:adenosylcobinamide kinase/adenosylcobinamide-phosphate guanylyltransferase